MSSAVSSTNLGVSMSAGPAGKGASISAGSADQDAESVDFKAILSGQELSPEILSELEELLPPDQLSQLQTLLKNGKGLPLSADIAEDSPLGNPALLQLMQQIVQVAEGKGEALSAAVKGDGSSLSKMVAATDLQGILAHQGVVGKTDGSGEQGKPGFSLLSDQQVATLLQKNDIPLPLQQSKFGLTGGDLASSLLQTNSSTPAMPLTAVVSGLEHLATQRGDAVALPAITIPPGEKGWDNLLSNRIMWMVGKQMQHASLQISPRHLGPIDIQVSMHNDQTSISFLAHNTAVKEALESAIPRLREMFADNSMQLVNVDVGQREAGSQGGSADLFYQSGGGAQFSSNSSAHGSSVFAAADAEPVHIITSSGLLDYYA